MLLRTIIVVRQAGHCIRDERLHVQDSILLLKTIIVARQARHCIKDKSLQVEDSILLPKKLLWQGKQDTESRTSGYRFKIVFCY